MATIVLLVFVIWLFTLVVVYTTRDYRYILLPYAIFLVNEALYMLSGFDMYNAKERTQIFYDLATLPTKYLSVDDNYSEGYYPDDDYSITSKQAEDNKFAKILEVLDAKPGDTILDFGSGTGSFEAYCHKHGIKAIGMTLSAQQVSYGMEKGADIEIIQWDYTKFNNQYKHQVDHILILGSPEHIHTGGPFQDSTYVTKNSVMAKLFEEWKAYFKQDGKPHRIFMSCLHINPVYCKTFAYYVLERSYGGTLPKNVPELDMVSAAQSAGYETVFKRDATRDYYLASALDPNHFGNPGTLFSTASNLLFLLGFAYPIAWHMLTYNLAGIWMWMFDGNLHYAWNPNLKFEDDMTKRPCTLWWNAFEVM